MGTMRCRLVQHVEANRDNDAASSGMDAGVQTAALPLGSPSEPPMSGMHVLPEAYVQNLMFIR